MKFKLSIYPAIEKGNRCITFKFETEAELMAAYNATADLLLFLQDRAKLMKDFSNVFIREQLIGGEWVELE